MARPKDDLLPVLSSVRIKLQLELNAGVQFSIFRLIQFYKSDISLKGVWIVGLFKERRGHTPSQSWGAVHHSHQTLFLRLIRGEEECNSGISAIPASWQAGWSTEYAKLSSKLESKIISGSCRVSSSVTSESRVQFSTALRARLRLVKVFLGGQTVTRGRWGPWWADSRHWWRWDSPTSRHTPSGSTWQPQWSRSGQRTSIGASSTCGPWWPCRPGVDGGGLEELLHSSHDDGVSVTEQTTPWIVILSIVGWRAVHFEIKINNQRHNFYWIGKLIRLEFHTIKGYQAALLFCILKVKRNFLWCFLIYLNFMYL